MPNRVGLIARADKSGLGSQTRRLARLLKPDNIMVINSTVFNGNKQDAKAFSEYDHYVVDGFPDNNQVAEFCKGIDVVISCELFYNNYFVKIAKANNTKTILIANPEFFDWFKPDWANIPLPDRVIVPSSWISDRMKQFHAVYLPTPIFDDEFKQARETNLKRTGNPRYLFLNGKTAAHDRAGLNSLYEALQLSKGDFEVVVKSQSDVPKHPDPRLSYSFDNPEDPAELYTDFDALIHPRRYGGQSLQVSEGLLSGLPVIMTDVDPNNKVLPKVWLVDARKTGEFMTRTIIDIYSADALELAITLDTLDCGREAKKWAYKIGQQYEAENLREHYERITHEL